MKEYRKRVADRLLKDSLESKGAVLIEGAKWCGKTTTALQQAKSVLYMQEPEKVTRNLELAQIKPSKLLEGDTPHLIDEWQMAPQLWDAVRFEVDKRDDFGQFILTGSAIPADTSQIYHSGVGRITKMLMRPMSLYESGDSDGSVSLAELFNDAGDVDGHSAIDIDRLAFLICRGGWPRALDCSDKVALRQAIDYYKVVVDNDISLADGVVRNTERVRRVMRSYARAVATQTTLETMAQDISADEQITTDTISSYLNVLRKIFVIEEAPAWSPNLRSKTAVRTSSTRYFTDPSIGAAALGLGPKDLFNDLNTMGLFFENMCFRDLRVYAETNDGSVYHYRDKNGLECDAIVHLRNGKYGLIEIKLGGARLIEEGAATLNKLAENIDTSKMKAPSFKMILTGTDDIAYLRKDGVMVVPVGCLKD